MSGRKQRAQYSVRSSLAFLLVLGVAEARADVIVAHPHNATCSGAFSNLVPGEPFHQQLADEFSLSQTMALESISWLGRYDAVFGLTNPVNFSVRFFKDAEGRPEASPIAVFGVRVGAANTGLRFGGSPWFSYSAPLGLTLDPGSYWVSVAELDPRTPGSGASQWLWGSNSALGTCSIGAFDVRAFRVSDGAEWNVQPGLNTAFTLTGTVRSGSPERLLTVIRAGSGEGTVTSNPAGIQCGTDCSENYADGATVALTATRGKTSTFAGWSGACSGKGSCVVVMEAVKTVTATFVPGRGAPAAPSHLAATVESSQTVRLTWRDNSINEAAFRIEMRRGQEPFQPVATARANEVQALISNLKPGSRYVFRVRARNSAGSSGYSNQVAVTTPR